MTAPQDPELTVRLDGTVRLDRTTNLRKAPATETDTDSPTYLDGEAWGAPATTVELPDTTVATVVLPAVPADEVPSQIDGHTDGLRRFGPGVPSTTATVPPVAAAVWHGTAHPGEPVAGVATPRPRRRRRPVLLVAVLLLLAVLGYLAWQRFAPPLAVTAVSVRTDPAGPNCDGTAVVVGTLETDGRAGTVSYRWLRSDGTVSEELKQPVRKGRHHTDVVLRWTFEGKGTMAATATLQVDSPTSRTAATSFTYTCH
ncbi:hypothetical protein [Kitasatospora azatica]|uniref:hypothetical protein n=1 Tax=Kitasatospora azatica TaxID=58347 RepID=UPI00068CCF72|nr:hypothetical protein [Kitasatospora azatica]